MFAAFDEGSVGPGALGARQIHCIIFIFIFLLLLRIRIRNG